MAKQYTTINDIAHAAGVSKTTVSRYLNGHFERMSEQTRQKIAQIIENIFSSLLFKGADQVLAAADYSIMLMNANNSATLERRQLERLIKLRVDGVILQPSLMNADTYQLLADAQVPTIDRKVTPAKWPAPSRHRQPGLL